MERALVVRPLICLTSSFNSWKNELRANSRGYSYRGPDHLFCPLIVPHKSDRDLYCLDIRLRLLLYVFHSLLGM